MRAIFLTFFLAAVLGVVYTTHTFLGTNVLRQQLYHYKAEYGSKLFRKRVENLYYAIPSNPQFHGKTIQGIIAYDLKNSEATANITQGGLGYNYVNIRMKSERGKAIDYDVYIYA